MQKTSMICYEDAKTYASYLNNKLHNIGIFHTITIIYGYNLR